MKLAEYEFPLLIVENLFNEEELVHVWNEIDSVNQFMMKPDSFSAKQLDGTLKKNNKACWIDMVYGPNRNASFILNSHKKIFNKDFEKAASDMHWFYRYMSHLTKDATLLNFYENDDHYHSHTDDSTITTLIWLWREPKAFTGGDMIFDDKHLFPIQNNTMVMFPSCINHEVTKVNMEDKPGYGRFAITIFSHII
jgi:hypothetical protein